jgi:hypothetical protein
MDQQEPSVESSEDLSSSIKEPEYSEDGVDLTLIRWMLSMTPTERLHVLQEAVRSLTRLRDGSFLS